MFPTAFIDSKPSQLLANWVQVRYPYARRELMTHLKLQKLLFYCVGAAMAFDVDDELGNIDFQAWEHGPVNFDIWKQYRAEGANPLACSGGAVSYSQTVERVMTNALKVYGALRAWSLRNQSHLEMPWISAYNTGRRDIDRVTMKAHFKARFLSKPCFAPEHLQDPGTFKIDGLPVTGYKSFQDLADSIYSLYQPQ